jgi:hypothetical protein
LNLRPYGLHSALRGEGFWGIFEILFSFPEPRFLDAEQRQDSPVRVSQLVKVPAAQKDQVAKLTDNYRQFREQRRKLTALEAQIEECLDQYEKVLTEEVRRPLAFLTSSTQLSGRRRRRLQVRESGKKPST